MKRGPSTSKRVLFTSHTANFQKFNHANMALFKGKGWQVDYASADDEKITGADQVFVVDFARSPWRIDKHIKAYRQLKKILAENYYDTIHTHTPVGSVITRLAARKSRRQGTRVIYTAHGFHFYDGASILNWLLWYPTEKIAARLTDTLITINKEDYERAKKHFKTDVIYVPGVGVEPKKFDVKMTKAERTKYREKLGLSPGDHIIIYVAELSKRKNQEALLKEVALMIVEKPNTHVLLVGKDSLNGKIQRLAQQLDIASNVHFLGYRKDVPQLLKIADEYRSTSRQEGLAVNIIEARVAGLPIKATKVRGHEPAFSEDISQFLLPNINKEMARIYDQPKRNDQIKRNGFLTWLGLSGVKTSWFEKLLLCSPIFLFMTHSPVLFLLQNGGETMRITPAMIYVALTSIAAIPFIAKNHRNLRAKRVAVVVLASLAYIALSLLWTTNILRGLVNVGSLVMLTLIFIAALCVKNWNKLFPPLVKILIAAGIFWYIFAWFQFWIGLFYPAFLNGFCNSCSAVGFGFVRPAGLAFEPQIFGNLLLAPTIVTTYLILKRPAKSKVLYVVLILFLMTLFLTLSRGAIYAMALGMIVLFLTVRPKLLLALKVALIGAISLIAATVFQGLAIQVNPSINASFSDGVKIVVEQLTLGHIDLTEESTTSSSPANSVPSETPANSPIYTGYVPISTNHRLSLTERALEVWHRDLSTMVFGTGVGSGAEAIAGSYDTVQNQYVEILLNYGLVGSVCLVVIITGLFVISRHAKFLWAILAAYLFQWIFFSGLPHGFFHVYFVLIGCFLYAVFISRPDRSRLARQS